MTAQTAEIMILDGKAFELHTVPLEAYFKLIGWRPSFARGSTANRRGYVARWELFGERLFLTGLCRHELDRSASSDRKLAPDPTHLSRSRII